MSITKTFAFTGAPEDYVFPSTLAACSFELWGADGLLGVWGGYLSGALSMVNVPPGSSVRVSCGGKGGSASGTTGGAGGFNGGAAGGSNANTGGLSGQGGSGATDVRFGGTGLANRILVAGGAGGPGRANQTGKTVYGGSGGQGNTSGSQTDTTMAIGADGYNADGQNVGGAGTQPVSGPGGGGGGAATQSTGGGAGSSVSPANASSGGTSGNGGVSAGQSNASGNGVRGGGGGGGGYYGGGGGGNGTAGGGGGGGGGGSSYWNSAYATGITTYNGFYAPRSTSSTTAGAAKFLMVVTADKPTGTLPVNNAPVAPGSASTFNVAWTTADSTHTVYSVSILYRVAGTSTWSTYTLTYPSGSRPTPTGNPTLVVSVPANTFTLGKRYEWAAIVTITEADSSTGGGNYDSPQSDVQTFTADTSHPANATSVSSASAVAGRFATTAQGAASVSSATAGANRLESAAATSFSSGNASGAIAPPATANAVSNSSSSAKPLILGSAAATSRSAGGRYQTDRDMNGNPIVDFYDDGFGSPSVSGKASAAATSNSAAGSAGQPPIDGVAGISESSALISGGANPNPTQFKAASAAATSQSASTAAAQTSGGSVAATSSSTAAVDSTSVGKSAAASSQSAATADAARRLPSSAAASSQSAATVSESPFLRGNTAAATSISSATGDPQHNGTISASAAATSGSTSAVDGGRQTPGSATATSQSSAAATMSGSTTRQGSAVATSTSSATAAATKGATGNTISKAYAFSDSIDGTFDADLATNTLTGASPNDTDDVVLVMTGTARLTVQVPTPVQPDVVRRARLAISLDYQAPVMIAGRPHLPKYGGQSQGSITVLQGVGHVRTFADPDPVWGGSSWTVAPPTYPQGANFVRWTARTLPDPRAFPGNAYQLGSADAADGTAGIASGARLWAAAPGSDFNIPWQSAYPFKPTVQQVVHYGRGGTKVVTDRAVHFNSTEIDHMWADFGSMLTPPFTILMVVLVARYDPKAVWNYLLDSGRDPTGSMTTAQRKDWLANGPDGTLKLPSENLGYRTALRVSTSQLHMFNDMVPGTRVGKLPFVATYKPQIIGFSVSGGTSYQFAYGSNGRPIRAAKLVSHGAQRLAVMGRANGLLSPQAASSMVVFEVRAWDQRLTGAQLNTQYDQLSTTWKFGSYK